MNRGKLEIIINKHSLKKEKKLSISIDKFCNKICDLPSEIKRQPPNVSEGVIDTSNHKSGHPGFGWDTISLSYSAVFWIFVAQ